MENIWNGIPPDILIPQTREDVENKNDKQLGYAINYINKITNKSIYVLKTHNNFEGYPKSIILYHCYPK